MVRLKVLQVEDAIDYQILFKQFTKKELDITLVATISDLKNISIKEWQEFQLIILDGQLPDGAGMDVMNYLANQKVELPVVANSSSDKYNQAMIQLGAKWSFNKDRFPKEIKLIISRIQDLTSSSQ